MLSRSQRRLLVSLLVLPVLSLAAPQDRLKGAVDSKRVVLLQGSRNARALPEHDRGPLPPETQIRGVRLILSPSAEQSAALAQLLEQQRDPSSPEYQHWLTPEEYGDRFGISENDLSLLASWLVSEGMTIDETARARNWIAFSGTAAQIGRAFQTELHRYQADGEEHFANSSEPVIPEAAAGIIAAITGLDDFRPRPPKARRTAPDYTASNGTHYLAPDDLAAIYDIAALYKAGFQGTGQKMVIVGQTDISLSDIRSFRSTFGLPAADPQIVLTGADPGVSSGDQVEADLDIEWSGAVARNASIIYVNSKNVFTSLQYAIDQNLAPVISMSYGGCESSSASSYRALAQQANAQGITWMNASGDSGAAGCDWDATVAQQGPAVTFPADIPEVTAVGGTEFNESGTAGWGTTNSTTWQSATGYIPEKAWNDTSANGLAASGGGASTVFAKPWWQAGTGVPNDGARDVPDISLTASGSHDAYLVYSGGSLWAVGGTSCASPSFAGIVGILNQYLVAKGAQSKPGLGNINPNLYQLAKGSPTTIHDITVGNNIVPCASGSTGCKTGSFGYSAGTGYDLVTGLGSVDAYNLVTLWTSLPAAVGTTTTLAASPTSLASTGSTQLTATVTPVSGTNPPTGTVTFTLGSTTLGTAAVVASGSKGAATLTVKGSSLATGSNSITASYAASGNFANSTASATVTLTAPAVATTTTAAANPTTIASSATSQVTATVKPASGSTAPGGSVAFTLGATTLGSATVSASGSNGTATLTIKGSSLAVGNNTITASYTTNGNFTNSSGTVTIVVTPPPVNTTTTLSASPASINQSASTVLTATVKAASGTTSPSGSVSFALGGKTLGTATLSGSGGSATATLTVPGSQFATGSNSVVATYAGTTAFNGSVSAAAVVTVAAPVATTTTAQASPASIASTASTQITATVKASSGTAAPTGSVSFTLGSTSLGSATLSASGSSATATLTVKGSSLAAGNNTITATYQPSGNFASSTATAVVNLTVPAVATTTTVTASPATLSASGTSTLSVTVKAASGTAAPTGSVTFGLGSVQLGTATLAGSSGSATATFTVKGSSLAAGTNTITVSYAGASPFSASSGTTSLSVTANTTANLVLTASKGTTTQTGFPVTLQLKESAGVAATISHFTINGTDFSSVISAAFGSTQIAANATLTSMMVVQWSPMPASLVFVLSGTDVNGHSWSQTATLATK